MGKQGIQLSLQQSISMKTKANQVGIHILCSIVFLLFPICSSPDFPHIEAIMGNPNGTREICSHILLLGFFYLSYSFLIPRFYFRQQYFLFYFWIALSAVAIFCILFGLLDGFTLMSQQHAIRPSGMPAHTGGAMEGPPPLHRHPMRRNLLRAVFFDYSLYLFLIVLFGSLLLKTNQRWRKLQQEKLETELSYLKAQINPHFLFNTLNSIYSLAIEKSDYTATAVVKLSGMMRYLISESNKHFVSLEKELGYISDYIELQKFRLGGTVKIHYALHGNYAGREIAPLILITFVENAFKYGVNPEEYSAISTSIGIEADTLILKVENNKVTNHTGKNDVSGLGISNTRHRLDMLYPGKYRLSITEDIEKFNVHLEVMLS